MSQTTSLATFAAGCFWGVQATFDALAGVLQTTVGYTGGHSENPTYKEVCSDTTGHAEAVLIEYDPALLSYDELLLTFWQCHNPTTRNRQGPDVGSQYRSVIFYHDAEQQQHAEASKQALQSSGDYDEPIVTEIVLATTFYPAEDYHQHYLAKHDRVSCRKPE